MTEHHQVTIPEEMRGKRLDQVLAELFPDYSRSRLQNWLKAGDIRVNQQAMKGKAKVLGGECIDFMVNIEPEGEWEAEDIPLDIQYEDEHILVVNKAAGMVVHPAVGNRSGTLLNALLHHHPDIIQVPRAGIVHRLDKDTSGLLVVAKTIPAQTHLVDQLQRRAFEREYEALVNGEMTGGGTVNLPMGRHPTQRTKMAVLAPTNKAAKEAITHYRVLQRYVAHTRIRVNLETGRTHQIRVHMTHQHYPLVGDPVYGGRIKYPPGCDEHLKQALEAFKRQALHAKKLGLEHPKTGEWLSWQIEAPEDMQILYQLLEAHLQQYQEQN